MTATPEESRGIYIGLGANLPSRVGTPQETLEVTLEYLVERGIGIVARSPWYASEPVPPSDQPWFVNGVAELETDLEPGNLLKTLHEIEDLLGRDRLERWEARVVDLDLLDFQRRVDPGPSPVLPHPSATERAFVLLPLRDVTPHWCDPVSGRDIEALIEALPAGGAIKKLG